MSVETIILDFIFLDVFCFDNFEFDEYENANLVYHHLTSPQVYILCLCLNVFVLHSLVNGL